MPRASKTNWITSTCVGKLTLDQAVTIDAYTALSEERRLQSLLSVDALLSSFPSVSLSEELAQRFLHGQRLSLGKEGVALPASTGRVRVYEEKNKRLLGTAQILEFGVLAPERLVVA